MQQQVPRATLGQHSATFKNGIARKNIFSAVVNVANKRLVLVDGKLIIILLFTDCIDDKQNKHNAELQRTDPGTKDTGEFSTGRRIFPHNAIKGFYSYHFS